MAVTIRQVAAKAGVTPIVVSRVLHNCASNVRVSSATAERIRETARDLGYRANVTARSFRGGKTMMIGVLHGIGFEAPKLSEGTRYMSALMDGFFEGACAHGYSITLCPRLMSDNPAEAIDDGRFDGLVWYSTYTSEENKMLLQRCARPIVQIHSEGFEYGVERSSVMCDNRQGMQLAVRHLFELGHRRIALAADTDELYSEFKLRKEAFLAILAEFGLATDGTIVNVRTDELRHVVQSRRFTAMIGGGDELAVAVIDVARECGIAVPDELSVVGWDSTRYCDEIRPKLTSVSQPLKAIGKTAIDLLVSSIHAPSERSAHIVYPCGFDIRESTKAIIST